MDKPISATQIYKATYLDLQELADHIESAELVHKIEISGATVNMVETDSESYIIITGDSDKSLKLEFKLHPL